MLFRNQRTGKNPSRPSSQCFPRPRPRLRHSISKQHIPTTGNKKVCLSILINLRGTDKDIIRKNDRDKQFPKSTSKRLSGQEKDSQSENNSRSLLPKSYAKIKNLKRVPVWTSMGGKTIQTIQATFFIDQ